MISSIKAKKIGITLLFFSIAGLCEIGGGYLVWLWLRDGMSWILGALGSFVLFLYGVVPTFQPYTSTESMQRMVASLSSWLYFGDGFLKELPPIGSIL
jgi:hypothetical protein